jgi:hypothetical protein
MALNLLGGIIASSIAFTAFIIVLSYFFLGGA